MRMNETLIDGDPERYEQRYTVRLGGAPMKFVRRPMVALPPPEMTVCFVDNGPRFGAIPRYTAGLFRNGKWDKKVKFEPTHWTHWDD